MRSLAALFAALLLFAPLAASAQPQAPENRATVRLFSPVTATGTEKAVPLAIDITLQDGWKTYWRTPGDAGLAPELDYAASANVESVDILYPAPHRFTIFDIDNYGYKKHVVLPIDVMTATPGQPLDFRASLDLLVCSDICVPETHEISFSLPAGEAAPSADKPAYDAAMALLPVPANADFTFNNAYLSTDSENIHYLIVTAQSARAPSGDSDLFVETMSQTGFAKPDTSYDRDSKTLTFKARVHSTAPIEALRAELLRQDATLTYVDDKGAYEQTLQVTETPAGMSVLEESADTPALLPQISLQLIFFAFLGGLILNLMPCVLPVLSLKVMSVLSHGKEESRRKIFRNFMASAAGIIASFWLMAGTLSVMKAAGDTIGWGIQFQHPAFLIFLIVIILVFALNMWGLFEIPLPRFIASRVKARHEQEPTMTGHFLTGAFATLLATPCTAPFLGTAIGFALAGSVFDIFTIFTFLGLGLALPYILLALLPGLFKYMPRPGVWMLVLRKLLALALVATALWLASVLYTVSTQPTLDAGWQKFDESLIAPAVADGKIVIVDITADWCITCKANKRLVLEQEDIVNAMSQANMLKLQGDWTQRDETIAAYLRKYSKFGIPFNIVYGPAAPDGIILPELLSKSDVTGALLEAAGE